ncbi:MAG: NFACT RNA binding domain-containing protein [Clostridium sp.]
MALDGIYLNSLLCNLKEILIDSKIDKINQPEKDEVILTIRKDRKNYKLLISASSNYARIHFTSVVKENPIQAPMFTMVMRKYLIGGRILDINQLDGDRVIAITITATDELGFDSKYILYVEIMGRHSNITLVRERDQKIMECIKHISPSMSSYRLLSPSLTYKLPPESNKLNPQNFSIEELEEFEKSNNIEFDSNYFSRVFTGISKPVSHSLFESLSNSKDTSPQSIYSFINDFMKESIDNPKYNIMIDSSGIYKDFYCINLNNNNTKSVEYSNPSEMMDIYHTQKDKQERLKNRAVDITRLINTNIDRCTKKSIKLNNILNECQNKDTYRIFGDLLTSFIYSFKKGDKSTSLQNFYSEDNEYITISLDENKTPSENVQFYYKKYNKLKKSEESALEQLSKNEEELQYLNSVLHNLESADNYNEIEEIKNELIESGYIRFRKNKKDKKSKASNPYHYVSSEGIDIYVGKNNIQNDYLSFKFAAKNFMWLHTKNIPGSHVIIAAPNVSDKTLIEAAELAAFYSKGKNSPKVDVDYTLVKNLKKPNGSKPGFVIYNTNYSLTVEPKLISND